MKVILDQPKEYILQQEMRETVDEAEITQMLDLPVLKKVMVNVKIGTRAYSWILWEGADYDAAGQWTDADVIAAVKAKIQST